MIAKALQDLLHQFGRSNVAKGASYTLLIRVFGAALAYLIQLLLARELGPSELGRFIYALTILSFVSFLTPLGFDTALVRYLAMYSADENWPLLKGILRFGFFAALGSSLLVSLVGISLILTSGDMTEPYRQVLLIACIGLPVAALINIQEGIALGLGWRYLVGMPTFALRPGLFVVGLLLVFSLSVSLDAERTMLILIGSMALTLMVQTTYYLKRRPNSISQCQQSFRAREWLFTALPMILIVASEHVLAATDIVMLGILDTPAATGIYNIAAKMPALSLLLFFAMSAFAGPRIAQLHNDGNTAGLIRFSRRVRFFVAVPTAFIMLILILAGPAILRFFGPDFEQGYIPMLILAIGVLARTLAGPVDNLLVMTGQQNNLAVILGIAAVINLITNSLLIPAYGAMGAAIATTSSVLFELIWVSIIAGKHIGFIPWLLINKESSNGKFKDSVPE